MKRASAICLIPILLASCTPAAIPPNTPTATTTPYIQAEISTPLLPSPVLISPTLTSTAVPPTGTTTPEPCDLFAADYCITGGHFLFQRPVRPPADTSVDPSYRYASTASGTRDPHRGVEFLNKFGTPVYAAGDGIVVFAGQDDQPSYSPWPDYYGNLVVIEHADKLYTLYAHLSKILVQQGQSLSAGELIGEVGQTGVAIGSHLHFEVRRGEVEEYSSTENPEMWLIPNPDESGRPLGAIQLSIVDSVHLPVNHAEFTLQHFLNNNQPSDVTYYGITYSSSMLKDTENAGMNDIPPGIYRIALTHNGQVYERWVEVESGRLTQVVIVVD